jgi:hypothetical protein
MIDLSHLWAQVRKLQESVLLYDRLIGYDGIELSLRKEFAAARAQDAETLGVYMRQIAGMKA